MATLLIFHRDLRLSDHSALNAAISRDKPIVPVYWEPADNRQAQTGASQWWLQQSLVSLNEQLKQYGGELVCHEGSQTELVQYAQDNGCDQIYFSLNYEPWLCDWQKELNETAKQAGIECKRFGGQLMLAPDSVMTQQNEPYKVFTPYYRACLKQLSAEPHSSQLKRATWKRGAGKQPKTWNPMWAADFDQHWQPGEPGAKSRLTYIKDTLNSYGDNRDTPSKDLTSRLSPHLHFGELSARYVWHSVAKHWNHNEAEPFLRQLVWREFSYYLLHHFPHIVDKPFRDNFVNFPWSKNNEALKKWQQGLTGYPLVDAGMRQLWQTGWMHNRVRMVVASFLTKHLRLHWLEGAKWFDDTLLDADLANNTAGWQWVAGSGADAAPYFRIFNPITQSEKFDGDGDYIREYVPELARLSSKHIHAPWEAPKEELARAEVELGQTYPKPMVDHKKARQQALDAYFQIKK